MLLLQSSPTLEAVLVRKRLLHFTKPRHGRVFGQRAPEPRERFCVPRSQSFEPTFGLLAQAGQIHFDHEHDDLPFVCPRSA